jgi:membrane fusion protein (multidrug efflux system)
MKRGVVIVSGVAVALTGLFGFAVVRERMIAKFLKNRPEPVVTVEVTKADDRPWSRAIAATGRLEAVNGVDIAAEVSGRVVSISFEPGRTAPTGAVLARLDSDVERAQLQSARAQVRLNRLTAERYRSLRRTDAASQAKLDEAEANLTMAEAEVVRLERTIEKKEIKAPFPGILGINRLDIGQYVTAGTKVTTVQDLSEMLMDLSVSQKFLPQIAVGSPVVIVVEAYPGRAFSGRLTAIEPKVDEKSGLIALQARFPNEDGALRPGMYAKARILLPSEDGHVVVPQTAINYSLYGDFLYVVRPDDKGEARAFQTVVKVIDRHDNLAAISGDVRSGDQLVAAGGVRLSHGSKVKVAETPVLKTCPPSVWTEEPAHAFHRPFHQAAGAGLGGQPADSAVGAEGPVFDAGAAVPEDRYHGDHRHHHLCRRRRRADPGLHHRSDPEGGGQGRRRRLHHLGQPRRGQRRHRAGAA